MMWQLILVKLTEFVCLNITEIETKLNKECYLLRLDKAVYKFSIKLCSSSIEQD